MGSENLALLKALKASSQLEDIQELIDSGEIGGSITVPDTNFFASNTARNTYFTSNPSQLVDGVYCVVVSQLQQYRVNTWVDISTTIRGPKGDKGDTGAQGIQGVQGTQGIKGDKGDKGEQGPQGPQGIKGDDGINFAVIPLTQTAYDALVTKDPNTFYPIIG